MTATRHFPFPPTAQWGPFLFMRSSVAVQFQTYRHAGPQLKTGTLLGVCLSPGKQILLTQAVSWPKSDLPLRPFAVGLSYQQAVLDIHNRGEGTFRAQAEERLPITQVGHWMVMPATLSQEDGATFAPTDEVCPRELAVLERAVKERWLDAPQLILAVREERGQTRVRAYVLKPGLPVYPVYFVDDELNSAPALLPQERQSAAVTADLLDQEAK